MTPESLREDLLALPKVEILELFKLLRNADTVGFNHELVKKTECVDRLINEYPAEAIDEAMRKRNSRSNNVPARTVPATAGLATNVDQGAIAQQIAGLFAAMAGAAVDESKVKAIVDSAIADAVSRLVNRVEIVRPELPDVDMGLQHQRFPLLLKTCTAKLPDGTSVNVWLTGPAGSGKTTAARNVAKALDKAFYFNGAISTPFELMGFVDANGRLVRTPFRDAWENGGVYLFDEVDSSNPNAVTAFNAALANGLCAFPDRVVERHADCIIIAGANTSGNGGTNDYVGRMKQDGAFLNRFVELHWPIDEKLETAVSGNESWARRVQGVRARVKERGIKGHMITPRATMFGASLLAAGIPQGDVEQMVLRKGLSEDAWNQIK